MQYIVKNIIDKKINNIYQKEIINKKIYKIIELIEFNVNSSSINFNSNLKNNYSIYKNKL